jgi:hypothetical protein
MTEVTPGPVPQVPPETDVVVRAWMSEHGWKVAPPRWQMDPEAGYYVWQEDGGKVERSHALWIAESMIRRLTAEELIRVLNSEDMSQEIRISTKVRIEPRGSEYRVSVVSRNSGEWKRPE